MRGNKYLKWSIALPIVVVTMLAMPILAITAGQAATASTSTTTSTTDTSTTTGGNSLQSVAQSYDSATTLQQGIIVEADAKNKGNVIPATYSDAKKMLGVVVGANSAAVSLSSGTSTQKVYVVTSGRYNVLVSTQNGPIAAGDAVSISNIDGIGMKADTVEPEILGRAVNSFDGKSNVISTVKLKTSKNQEISAAVGSLLVDINITKNPMQTSNDSGVPTFVQKAANSIVGHDITAPQFYISAVIMLGGFGIVASLLYGGIQSGMTAIGRNPLAKQTILRNVIQVIITGLIIFIGCLFAVYLVLKL